MSDFTEYPSAVLESCEDELRRSGLPEWFINGFQVSEENRALQQWGKCEINVYQWPKFMIKDPGGWRLVDIEPLLTDAQILVLKLTAVAREWLRVFGDRSPYEMALACTFCRLEALWNEQNKRANRARDNGEKSGDARRKRIRQRDKELSLHALELLSNGKSLRDLVGILHASKKYRNPTTGGALTKKSIREILRKHGVLEKK